MYRAVAIAGAHQAHPSPPPFRKRSGSVPTIISLLVAHGFSDAEWAVFLGLVVGVPAFFLGAYALYRILRASRR